MGTQTPPDQHLVEFLLARIADDEAIAREAPPGPWRVTEDPTGIHVEGDFQQVRGRIAGRIGNDHGHPGMGAAHIARHNPTRVLAECEAKRQIVQETSPWLTDPGDDYGAQTVAAMTLRYLALPYADHPDYRQEWRL